MKLYIREAGDMSVGIFPAVWEIECPFEEKQDKDTLDWFKEQMLIVYSEFAETKLSAYYEDEKEAYEQ